MNFFNFFALSFLFTTTSYALEVPSFGNLHPNTVSHIIKNGSYTFEYHVVSLNSAKEVKEFSEKYKTVLATEKETNPQIDHPVFWINAPILNRSINTVDENNFSDPENVADHIASDINGAKAEQLDLTPQARKTLLGKIKQKIPTKNALQLAVISFSLNGVRISANTYNKYIALLATTLPTTAIMEHTAAIFAWCTLSAAFSHPINNFVNHRTFTANDEKAALYSYTPKNNEERSVLTALQNLYNGKESTSRYFRFALTELLFLGPTVGIEALINIANGVAPLGPEATPWGITLQLLIGTIACTVSQGRSEIANDKFREWSRVINMHAGKTHFYSKLGFAFASILSVTGGLHILGGEIFSGGLYLTALTVGSHIATKFFQKKIDSIKLNTATCDEALSNKTTPVEIKNAG